MISSLSGHFRGALDTIRHESFPIFLWRVATKPLAPIVVLDHQILFEIDLTQPIEQRRARLECSIEEATASDIEELLDFRFPPVLLNDETQLSDADEYRTALAERGAAQMRAIGRIQMRQWFRAGEKCFVARVDGEIAHSNWSRYHGCARAPHREIDPREGEVYTTEGFTAVKFRGKAIHEAVLSYMLRFAQARGCRLAYTITDYTNGRSRRGVLRIAGWRRRGHHLFIAPRRLGRTWMLRLGGDVEPIVRDLQGVPVRLL